VPWAPTAPTRAGGARGAGAAAGAGRGAARGGNLALLAALVGTPYAPRFEGAIVVLEDVNEAVYRVDRMLRQLLLAGAFAGCRALVFGHCTGCPSRATTTAGARSTRWSRGGRRGWGAGGAGVPVGHIAEQWTLPARRAPARGRRGGRGVRSCGWRGRRRGEGRAPGAADRGARLAGPRRNP
jgi:muramoyltetrapeptide carboxypeptidase